MTNRRSKSTHSSTNDYEVGYGRPPKGTRFQRGKGGNPSGRPKVDRDFGAALREALNRQIEVVNEKGDRRKVYPYARIAQGLVADSMRRDRAAIRQLLQVMHLYIDGGKPADHAKQREAELAEAKASLIAKLEAMAARVRNVPGGDGDGGQT